MRCRCGKPKYVRGLCASCYAKRWRSDHLAETRTRQREYWHRRLKNPQHRVKWNIAQKRRAKQRRHNTIIRLGGCCRFSKCGAIRNLVIHHDHRKQKRLRCCHYGHGCIRCQVCLLCKRHNHMLGAVNDSLRLTQQVIAFLRRYH